MGQKVLTGCSESAKEEESVTAKGTAISVSRPNLILSVVVVGQLLAVMCFFLGAVRTSARRLGLFQFHRHPQPDRQCVAGVRTFLPEWAYAPMHFRSDNQ
jgi:hypothetical protein